MDSSLIVERSEMSVSWFHDGECLGRLALAKDMSHDYSEFHDEMVRMARGRNWSKRPDRISPLDDMPGFLRQQTLRIESRVIEGGR